jgi:hypothetical protein
VQLSKAGFYFAPSGSSPDNCRCFLCEVQLDGWEDGDNPAVEHYMHSSSCGWAVNCYIRHMFESNQTLDEDPLSTKYADARVATFQGTWPHENKRGWKCKVSKVRAWASLILTNSNRWLKLDGTSIPD